MKVQEQPATDSPKPCLSEAVCVMNAAVPKSHDEPDSTTLCWLFCSDWPGKQLRLLCHAQKPGKKALVHAAYKIMEALCTSTDLVLSELHGYWYFP